MMSWNVHIEHFKKGRLVEEQKIHNVVLSNGRRWLSQLVAYTTIGAPDVPENIARIKYFGLGLGSVQSSPATLAGQYGTAYPPGFDPEATDGQSYQTVNPTGPHISTLERPIRRSGTTDPYNIAPNTDVWLYEDIEVYRQDNQSVTFRVTVDATGGELVYGGFTEMYISEAALFNDENSTDPNAPYSPATNYVHFDTIQLTMDSIVVFSWSLRFG